MTHGHVIWPMSLLGLSQIYLFWTYQMVDPIFFTLDTILRPLEVAPGASAPPPLPSPCYATVASILHVL